MSEPLLISRRLVHRGAPLVVLAAGVACLVGFARISFSPGSPPFRWAQLPVSYVIQARGSADVPDGSDHAAVQLGFKAWEDLPASNVSFVQDLAQDENRTDYQATDIHLVLWDDDGSSGLFAPGAGIIALTPLLASTADGTIFDADIVFNGGLSFSTSVTAGTFDVQAVATHEIGHFIGFDHSGGPLTTMFAAIQAGQLSARSPSRDEEAGATHAYPLGATNRARFTGTIVRQGGPGVSFPQVVAVDEATGEVAATALGAANGDYALEGLPAGTYRLYAEALDGPFAPGDTISLQGQAISPFDTTWAPGGPFVILAGQSLGVTWAVAGDGSFNASAAPGIELLPGGGRSSTITGTNLGTVAAATVTGQGVNVTGFTVLPPSRLRVDMVAAANAGLGVRCIQLTDASGRVAMVTAGVEVVAPAPQVTQVTPSFLLAAGGQLLTLTGQGFTPGSQVVVGGQLAPQVMVPSTTRIDCVSPPSPGLPGQLDVVVIRPDGREGRLPGAVAYENAPVPTAIDPAFAPVAGGTTHVLRGTGFVQGMSVTIGGNPATVLALTGTEATLRVPPGVAGPADVTTSFGNAEATLAGGLTYVNAAAPVITSFAPASGPSSGGTGVTIIGTGFPADAQVTFDGVAASNVNVSGGTQIACSTPAHAAGAAELRVRDPSTQLVGVAPTAFSYDGATLPPPPNDDDDGCGLRPAGRGSPSTGALALLGALLLVQRGRSPQGRSRGRR